MTQYYELYPHEVKHIKFICTGDTLTHTQLCKCGFLWSLAPSNGLNEYREMGKHEEEVNNSEVNFLEFIKLCFPVDNHML